MSNRHCYRNRLRHKHLRALSTGSMLVLAPVFFMIFFGLWWDTHCTGYFGSYEYNDARFIEFTQKASEWVEDYRNQYGCLPDTLKVDCLRLDTLAVEWEGAIYEDTSIWRWTSFRYRHDGTSYTFTERGGYRRFISTPDSALYVFRWWYWTGDSMACDIVRHYLPFPVRGEGEPVRQSASVAAR